MNHSGTVVIFKLGSLGDTVMSLPFFHRIAERHPQARRVLLTNIPVAANAAPAESVLDASGLVHEVVSYTIGLRSVSKLAELRNRLASFEADTLFYLQECDSVLRAARDLAFFRTCGIARVVGAPLVPDLRRRRRNPQTGLAEPECERLARCLAAIGPFDLKARSSWDMRLTEDERRRGCQPLETLGAARRIAINMGGKVARNDWGRERWRALMQRLGARHAGLGLFVVGAEQDAERGAEIGAAWPGPFVNLCGRLAPRLSAAALETATVFIGHDSGPLHLAAASGVTCVGLYGDKNPPGAWHPYFGRHWIIHDMRGVERITVDAVESAANSILDGSFPGDAASGTLKLFPLGCAA